MSMSLQRRVNLLLCHLKESHPKLSKLLNLKKSHLMEVLMKIILRKCHAGSDGFHG